MIKRTFDFKQISSGLLVPVLLIVVAGVGYFVLLPRFKSVSTARESLSAKKIAASDRQSSLDGVKALVAELERRRVELAPIDQALPESPSIPELLGNLESLARQSGLAVSNIEIQLGESSAQGTAVKKVVGENLATMMVDLEVSGQYPQLLALILNMESNLRLLDIQGLTFTEGSEDSRTQDYVIQLKTYYQKK